MSSLPDIPIIFSTTNRAETLFESCNFVLPTGTASLAADRSVDVLLLSRAYGHTLGKSVLESLPLRLDIESLTTGLLAAIESGEPLPLPPMVFEAWLMRMRTAAAAPKLNDAQLRLASRMYGALMGRTVLLTGFELDLQELASGLEEFLVDPSNAQPPMDKSEFDKQLETLQDCATTVLGATRVDNADRFFDVLRKEDDVQDVQGDGYILSVDGDMETRAKYSSANPADLSSTVRVVLRARLLDGRLLYMPGFSNGKETSPEVIEATMDQIPPALSCIFCGMRAGETKTAFYHPYAAHEIMGMFLSSDQFPPQSGIVVDVMMSEVL